MEPSCRYFIKYIFLFIFRAQDDKTEAKQKLCVTLKYKEIPHMHVGCRHSYYM